MSDPIVYGPNYSTYARSARLALEDPPGEPHSHAHRHTRLRHSHRHFPDAHHTHGH